ncbi:(R,S)-reticuline 7-O-methyltransferase-like [Neltuma alba]|uniref:(R,S)-reticuline 7-O-methyltransferase-like n=1 Tax=Neltuma alba TaxID=207710 RepID=UPI0010A3783F|nr:(R,S)-reticuline 7-O-methyltransferase-like [Prosopis alba]XP_028807904.1 (R,S)-reticuline 7-O-methyltransferase-like [Prosopis alba]
MGEYANGEEALALQGQALVWSCMFSFVDSMALKCAVELRIPDIIHRHGGPISLSQITASLADAPSPDPTSLARVMRLLVRRNIFTAHHPSDSGDTLYGLTHSSRWLLSDSDLNLAPALLMQNHPALVAPWHYLSHCVREGGPAFKKAHGREIWELASESPEFNKLFNDGMACTARMAMRAVVSAYKEGFESIGSLVDVGGNIGGTASEIVKAYPHIKCINFDLPHVIATAPEHDGVTHVGGDMFHSIPPADAVFMKWILHDWSDEDCIKILKNCKKAIEEVRGKVIIAEFVLKPEGRDLFDETGLVIDLLMIAHSSGGKERTELEWKDLLHRAGFPRYRIIQTPSFLSIIEASPF